MEVESGTKYTKPPPNKPPNHRRRNICLAVLAVFILVVIIIVILAFTVFKAKKPVTTVNSVNLKDLDVSLDILRLRVNLNVSLNLDLSIKNPNKVGMKYKNTTALVNYRGELVGEVPIPADKVSADETKEMNLTLVLMADRFLSNSQAYSDVLSGSLPLNAHTKVSGKVNILGFIKIHVTSTASCDLVVFVSNRTVGDQQCKYKTQL